GAEGLRGVEQRGGHESPDEHAAEKKEHVGLHVRPGPEDEAKDGRVHREKKQRIDERPEVAEDPAAVARGELPPRQGRDERALAKRPEQRREQTHSPVGAPRRSSTDRKSIRYPRGRARIRGFPSARRPLPRAAQSLRGAAPRRRAGRNRSRGFAG